MTQGIPSYSVVVPVFNSAETLNQLTIEIEDVFSGIDKSFELIYVDDCSSDDSWKVLQQIKVRRDNVKIILLAANSGQNTATISGIHESLGEQIITIDDDLQYPSTEILKIIEFYNSNSYQIVYGQPGTRMHGMLHRVIAYMASFAFAYIILFSHRRIKFYTTFRIMAREIFFTKDNALIPGKHLFYFWDMDPSLMGSLHVEHESRKSKSSNYSLVKLFRHYQPQLLYTAKRLLGFLQLAVIVALGYSLISSLMVPANSSLPIELILSLASVFLFLLLMRYACSRRLIILRETKYTIAEKIW